MGAVKAKGRKSMFVKRVMPETRGEDGKRTKRRGAGSLLTPRTTWMATWAARLLFLLRDPLGGTAALLPSSGKWFWNRNVLSL